MVGVSLVSEKVTRILGCQMATSNSVKLHKLRRFVASLSGKEGRGMEFISLYVPRESSVDNVVASLKCELDSAESKSDGARDVKNRLQEAIKNLIQHVRLRKELPENGLALFAGTFVSDGLEGEVLNVQELVPPEHIAAFLYVVDNHFHLEPLREMLRSQKVVGLIAVGF